MSAADLPPDIRQRVLSLLEAGEEVGLSMIHGLWWRSVSPDNYADYIIRGVQFAENVHMDVVSTDEPKPPMPLGGLASPGLN